MRAILFLFLWSLCGALPALAQTDFTKQEKQLLHSDFKQAVAVAHVKIETAEIFESNGYVTWRLRGAVVEKFKGEFANQSPIEFFAVVEPGYDAKHFLREEIVFLNRYRDKASGSIRYSTLENASRLAEDKYPQFFRKLIAKKSKSRICD